MSYPGFPTIFYSKDALATRTLLLTNGNGLEHNPKINWNTCVIDPEEENIGKAKQNYLAPYNDNDGLLDCLDIEDNYEILPTKSGKFITTFHVPTVLIPVIVGPKGSKLKHLQEITQTMIKVPRIHEIGVPVKITGHSERSVASARNQVTLLTLSKREKLLSTHFISIPVTSDEVKANFEKFKMEILNGQATRGIDETIFQNSEKLHLTVEVLRLLDEFEIESAKQLLSENVREFLQKPYYKVKLKGVEIMNDDPSDADVLYAKVEMEENNDLTNFEEVVSQISDLFHINGKLWYRDFNMFLEWTYIIMNIYS
ncbi:hypothetical protein WA026_001148 [Henosepilachna vigintioctopunctata]|uniref:K Homology domain-containing protein n=1 Tax=Henosepilachna vigintioctopunctata TaxID=420089 RepID=A0AAW1V6B0_9CUCU